MRVQKTVFIETKHCTISLNILFRLSPKKKQENQCSENANKSEIFVSQRYYLNKGVISLRFFTERSASIGTKYGLYSQLWTITEMLSSKISYPSVKQNRCLNKKLIEIGFKL